jgi:hypothetical protein
MSEIKRKAMEARALMADRAFQDVIAEIKADAVALFLRSKCSIDDMQAAHDRVQATETFLDALRARIDAETIEDKKKAQDRYGD